MNRFGAHRTPGDLLSIACTGGRVSTASKSLHFRAATAGKIDGPSENIRFDRRSQVFFIDDAQRAIWNASNCADTNAQRCTINFDFYCCSCGFCYCYPFVILSTFTNFKEKQATQGQVLPKLGFTTDTDKKFI